MIASAVVDRDAAASSRLALVPIGVGLVFGLLLLPRRASPEAVPLPIADGAALHRASDADRALATRSREAPLPATVRALGSAIRAFHVLEADGDAGTPAMAQARRDVDQALVDVLPGGVEPLLALRAVQLEAFLDEVRAFEATGTPSDELKALGGSFLRSLAGEGWVEGRAIAPDATVLAVMFKHMWNSFLGLEGRAELKPSLDEERALYAFYLSHAHPTKAMREALEAARRGAADARACRALEEAERAAVESWRLDHIARLAAIDPAYPADYARGVVQFRRGDYGASSTAFQTWLAAHPDGPLTLRAQNFLRAADTADRAE